MGVNEKVLELFKEATKDILLQMPAEEALQRAFAYMCG